MITPKILVRIQTLLWIKRLRQVLRRLWFFQVEVSSSERRHGGERDCCPRLLTLILSHRSVAALAAGRGQRLGTTASCSVQQATPRRWSLGSGQREPGLKRETISGNSAFLPHVLVHVLQGVKAKVPFLQYVLTMAEITPTTSLVVEIPETRV